MNLSKLPLQLLNHILLGEGAVALKERSLAYGQQDLTNVADYRV